MSIKLKDISTYIEELAPLGLAENWDNCGWQVYCGDKEVTRILVVLSVTPEALDIAINDNYDVIVSHHPITISGVKSITPETLTGQIILGAAKHGISIYSAHTNLDKIQGGVSDLIAEKLELINLKPLVPEKQNPDIGLGRIGELKQPVPLNKLIETIKEALELKQIKVINQAGIKEIKTIAICGGSGASLISQIPKGIDLYLTGDIKYHDALEALEFVLIDANHSNTEELIVDDLVSYLSDLEIEVEGFKSPEPWQIF